MSPLWLGKDFTIFNRMLVMLWDVVYDPSVSKSDLQSLDFVINRFFMKLFTTKNIEIVKYCQEYFGFALPSALWAKRVSKF